MDTTARGTVRGFADSGRVSGYAAEAMRWAVGSGLVDGKGGLLDPIGTATRGEVATIMQRMVALMVK